MITRASQFIRIYGIDFESNLTRGTQYRVEGILERVTHSKGYLLLSASSQQRMSQSPPLFTPIVIEPPKNIFFNPVIVLDFQSLYPSIMIAYNLCYSTCLGKLEIEQVQSNKRDKKFGVSRYNTNLYNALKDDYLNSNEYKDLNKSEEEKFLNFLMNNCLVTPNQICFVKKNIREGILPIVLKELLLTRIMVKKSMKLYPPESTTYKRLHNRQLGIKLLANVIYGYTSAGFSGRMPNNDIGDSIVSLGKTIVLSATKIIESNPKWNAKVIYGDTDSLFISITNASIKEAIEIGKEMADIITRKNPEPMKLQFEKVYCPLVFNSKKHYAGYKWESKEQIDKKEINLDTKGIENVRRDTCDAIAKMIEKIIKILFQKKDLTLLKNYLYSSFDKIISGRVIFKDFIFSKKVKFGTYRRDNPPPSAVVAFNLYLKDKSYFASFGERVPYLVYNNPLGEKTLINSVISPYEFFSNFSYSINSDYYIEVILRVVNRFLECLGVDVYEWYKKYKRPISDGMNYYYKESDEDSEPEEKTKSKLKSSYQLVFNSKSKNIEEYFKRSQTKKKQTDKTKEHLSFRDKVGKIIFGKKKEDPRLKILYESKKKRILVHKKRQIETICRLCSGFEKFNIEIEDVPCVNYQCKLFFEKRLCDSRKNKKIDFY